MQIVRMFWIVPMLLVFGCPKDPIHPQKIPPSDPKWCKPAEERLIKMECPWAKNANGIGYAEICVERLNEGVEMHAECIATDQEAQTCADFAWSCGCAKTDENCRKSLKKI